MENSEAFTPAQLHLLRQQIKDLRHLNVQMRILKYKARAGMDLSQPAAVQQHQQWVGGRMGGRGRGQGRGSALRMGGSEHGLSVGGRARGRGRGRGRGGKRGSENSEDDDSIVVRTSEEEGDEDNEDEEAGAEEVEQPSGSKRRRQAVDEYESADSSESEDDYTLPTVSAPRRTGRVRRPGSAAATFVSNGSAGSRLEEEAMLPAPQPSSPTEKEQAIGSGPLSLTAASPPSKHARSGTSGGSGGNMQQALFRVVSDDAASSAAVQLLHLKPVVSQAPTGEGSSGGSLAEEDVVCSVCGDGDAVEGNFILMCEGKRCSVAVHQLCYGVSKIPAGKWLCEACKGKLNPLAGNCCMCPVVGSAVKKVTSFGRVVPCGKSRAVYCHLACALWVPVIELADHERMAGVRLDKLNSVRVRLKCELCKQAGGGAVQCAFSTCRRSFHVLCGRGAGQTLTFRRSDGEPLAFCALHSQPAFDKMVEDMVDGTCRPAAHVHDSPGHDD